MSLCWPLHFVQPSKMVFSTSLSFQSLVNPNCIHREEFMLIACCLKNFPRKIFQHWMEVDSKSEFQWQTLYFHLFTLRALLHTGFLSHNPTLFAYPSIFVQIPIHISTVFYIPHMPRAPTCQYQFKCIISPEVQGPNLYLKKYKVQSL